MKAATKALIAIPVSNNPITDPGVNHLARRSNAKQILSAPQKAAPGNNHARRASGMTHIKCPENTIAAAAAAAAPLLTPSNPGSANGLRNNPCVKAPANPRLAPMTIENKILGNLTCHKM